VCRVAINFVATSTLIRTSNDILPPLVPINPAICCRYTRSHRRHVRLQARYVSSLHSTRHRLISITDGRKERVQFDKITARVSRLCYGLDAEHVDAAAITQKVISGVYQGVTTVELDNLVSISSANAATRADAS
jgi:hypothetical protein